MERTELKSAVEAILFACGTPVEAERMAQVLSMREGDIIALCEELKREYETAGRGIRIVRMNNSYQMCTEERFAEPIRAVMDLRRNTPLSAAAAEVLAVIAYNQPVTKSFVEQVRGVDCSGVISGLLARQLIEEKGRLELPGKPLIYGTTDHFLRCFNIASLDELPPLPDDEESEDDTSHVSDTTGDADTAENSDTVDNVPDSAAARSESAVHDAADTVVSVDGETKSPTEQDGEA